MVPGLLLGGAVGVQHVLGRHLLHQQTLLDIRIRFMPREERRRGNGLAGKILLRKRSVSYLDKSPSVHSPVCDLDIYKVKDHQDGGLQQTYV